MSDIIAARILLIVLVFSAFNTGLIWLVQLVHYPGFLKIPEVGYTAYQQFHMRSISFIVAPSMVGELFLSGILLLSANYLSLPMYWISLILLMIIWGVTFFVAVPLHGSLVSGFNAERITYLVNVNWVRTISWTLRTIVLALVILPWIKP